MKNIVSSWHYEQKDTGPRAYYLNLFSPETYEAFTKSKQDISGFRLRQRSVAEKIRIGDKFICYLTRLSRWIGCLKLRATVLQQKLHFFMRQMIRL